MMRRGEVRLDDDAFGLLLATCADCIGAAEVVPEGAALTDDGGA